ncbi:MAG TPA: AAA family ATPase [Umezawaea sp.]|nr:AAA family ATPase [Umezawaea sp.]
MAKILITGMSGTGKSSALRALGARGHRTVDTDDEGWTRRTTLPDGSTDRVWREEAVTDLLTGHRSGHLFVAGCRSNQGSFYPLFDHVVLLSAPAGVLRARITARTDNPYGKRPEEWAEVLRHLAVVEPLLRAGATAEVDATAPLDDVVRRLEELARARIPAG